MEPMIPTQLRYGRAIPSLIVSLLLTTGLLVLAGCSAVYSTRPMGEAPCVVDAEVWEGTWINHDGALTIKVRNAGQGALQVAWVEDDDGQLELESFDVKVLQSGPWIFCNLKDSEAQEERYLWGRIKNESGLILVWFPEVDKIATLVEQGLLPGTQDEDGDVVLSPLTAEQLQVITSAEHGVVLDWEDPLVLWRLSE